MTLRRQMTLQTGAMIAGLLLACAAALWGVNGLRGDLGLATSGYRELREMYEVATHVANARTLLGMDATGQAATEIDRALTKLDLADAREKSVAAKGEDADDEELEAAFRESIRQAAARLRLPPDAAFHAGPAAANESINRALGQAAGIALSIRATITRHEQTAERRWRWTIRFVSVVSVVVVLASVGLGVRQYRGVISPLQKFTDAARRIAAGRFSERVAEGGAAEFTALARDFNRMAAELEALYRDLEQKVSDQSRELARSERLASVGYLAAGVAHEINNPLGVISGYGERAIQHLERGGPPDAALRHLRVICEEAFRCKSITDKLLTLARPGDEDRRALCLSKLAAEVVDTIRDLPACGDRKIMLDASGEVLVAGSAGELKQVMLNLVLNAIDAGTAGGEIRVKVEAIDGVARLCVADNGRGMSAATLDRVFEPFYTEKRGSQTAGTGLGLSISHAIIASHGGHLRAASDGPGLGSRFVIELPEARTAAV